MTDLTPELRALVAQVVRDVVSDLTPSQPPRGGVASPPVRATSATASPTSTASSWSPSGPARADERSRVEAVRITGDPDLHRFVIRLLDLFENPKTRTDLRAGRLRFELTGGVAAAAAPGAVHRIEKGAVTERVVGAAAESGSRLLLGRRAVLTPLAREKARVLGVPIEKER